VSRSLLFPGQISVTGATEQFAAQAGEILHGARVHGSPGRCHHGGGRIRPGEASDPVPGLDELAMTAEPMNPLAPVTNTRMIAYSFGQMSWPGLT